jgi:hypothetical protein
MSKADKQEESKKESTLDSVRNKIPETVRDKKFWGGIGITALATYIFSPLAMAGGAFVGGMMGVKAAAKYDNPATPKMNFVRKAFAAFGGAAIGTAIVFGLAFLGGIIGGPVGAVIGAAVGAAITYKVSSSVVAKYAAPEKPQTPVEQAKHAVAKGKERVQEHAKGAHDVAKAKLGEISPDGTKTAREASRSQQH